MFKVLTAADIPAGGKNDINGPSIFGIPLAPEEVKNQQVLAFIKLSKMIMNGTPVT